MIPTVETDTPVAAAELLAVTEDVFRKCRMNAEDAHLLADSLVEADLSGVHSHGVLRIPEYVKKLTAGGVNPQGRPHIAREMGGCLVVDGGNSMGQIGMQFALDQAVARASVGGLSVAAIRGSNHCGALAYFSLQIARRDMIAMVTTNAMPTMAAWGGAERLLGINPVSYAIPAGREQPVVYDAAFSASAHGKIRVYKQKGLQLPADWAADQQGRMTTDPAVAIDGLLLPIGGYKGAAMAMIMGLLSSMLSGADYGTELGDMYKGPKAGHDGHFLFAISVAAFEDVVRFKDRVDAVIAEIHASKLAPGVDRVYVPGEKEHLTRADYLAHGIPLNAETLADIRDTAAGLGIDSATYGWLN